MPASGTRTFRETDRFEASLRQTQIESVITPVGQFSANLIWAELHHLKALRCEEEFPRIAYLKLPLHLVFVAFAHSGGTPTWSGMPSRMDEIILFARGEHFHQTTAESCGWSAIAVDPGWLEGCAHALTAEPFLTTTNGLFLRPNARALTGLRRLHARACRLALTKPQILTHPEVARALEQNLVETLVNCVTTAKNSGIRRISAPGGAVMAAFEEALAGQISRQLPMSELCRQLGVSHQMLWSCCTKTVGLGPHRYMRLRRLKLVRLALGNADPDATTVSEIARNYGFTELGRFAELYRATYGENPAVTLRRTRETRFCAARKFINSA